MKKVFLFAFFLVIVSGICEEVLLQIPFSYRERLKGTPLIPVAFFENSIIARTVKPDRSPGEKDELANLPFEYKLLSPLPAGKDEIFYIVYHSPYLNHSTARFILKEKSTILAEDGNAFFVKAKEEEITSILHLGFDITYVSLQPVVLPEPVKEEDKGEGEIDLQENPVIREILDRITPSEIAQIVRELSGEVPVTVRGRIDTIRTRYATAAKNSSAAWYIYEKLSGYNLDSVNFHTFSWSSYTDSNVIGTKNGRVYPRRYYIIGGHFDCTSESPSTYAPGADDNASGVVAAMIAAKYMSLYPWKYTIKFIAWNAEEFGLYGSDRHAQLVQSQGDSLLGVINGDMIATELTNLDSVRVYTGTRTSSRAIGDTFFAVNQRYNIGLGVRRSTSMQANSDHYSYYSRGYDAVHVFEDDMCPYYHTTGDRITASSFDTIYFCKVVKAMVATLATFAQPDTELLAIGEKGNFKPLSSIEISPNPFSSSTVIKLPKNRENCQIGIYDSEGREVISFSGEGKRRVFSWDGKNKEGKRRPGIYFLRISNKELYKLVLLRSG
jgi:hypothetical protein